MQANLLMHRRHLLSGIVASSLRAGLSSPSPAPRDSYLELKTWRLHNTPEDQPTRVAAFLESGLAPALNRAGASLIGAFSNVIGPDSPCCITLTQYQSLAQMEAVLAALAQDSLYQAAVQKLSAGPGLPFVRLESSLLRTFGPRVPNATNAPEGHPRIFEMRTYESQSLSAVARKVAMFEQGEIQIFERLGMSPVFFAETIVGARMPCIIYMLAFEDLAARERLWRAFGSDPEWKKLSSHPELKDPQIVENISNVILQPLKFSQIR
jgi:hypothetical protein